MVKQAPKRAEAAIQRAVVDWVRREWPMVKVVATLNENNRHCMNMGCDDGITDLILMWTPMDVMHTLFLELKTKNGTLQPNQQEWSAAYHIGWAGTNTHYATAYGFEHACKIIACILLVTMLEKHCEVL